MTGPTTTCVLDPRLPGLQDVVEQRAAAAGAPRVRHVDWQPGRRCTVVLEARVPGSPAVLTAHVVTPTGTEVVTMADDMALPGLPVAADGDQVRARLNGTSAGPVVACAVAPVGYRPGSRAVLAYDVTAPGGRRTRLFAKLLSEGSGAYATAAHELAAGARRRGDAPPVPDVVAVWDDIGAVVQRAAPGRVLSQVVSDPAVPVSERLDAGRRLGSLLAGVHASRPGGGRPWGTDDELARLEGLLAPAWHADPPAGRALASMLDLLAGCAPPSSDVVLGHGAFRTGQVIHDDGRLQLLDLDGVGPCEAALDAGNAVGYLMWARLRGVLPASLAAGLGDAFLDAYAEARTAPDRDALRWWTAACLAKIAGRRFRSLAMAQWPLVPGLLGAARELLEPRRPPAPGPARPPRPRGQGSRWDADPLDPAVVTRSLRCALAGRHPEVRVVQASLLGEAAGRRLVLRYAVEGLAPGPVRLVGKVYADRHRSTVADENLSVLGGEVFRASPGLHVPARVCHLPALRMVLYREVDGLPLELDDEAAAVRGARAAARWLATLHRSPVVLARVVDPGHEVVNAGLWAERVAHAVPSAGPAALALAGALTRVTARLPSVPHVPVHKDLHAGHVLTGGALGDAVVVIDLDEARMGDPALDVAHLRAYLGASPRAGAAAAREAFLAAYGPLGGPQPGLRSDFYEAYTSLKIAKQLATGRGPLRMAEGSARDRAVEDVLQRGAACLPG